MYVLRLIVTRSLVWDSDQAGRTRDTVLAAYGKPVAFASDQPFWFHSFPR